MAPTPSRLAEALLPLKPTRVNSDRKPAAWHPLGLSWQPRPRAVSLGRGRALRSRGRRAIPRRELVTRQRVWLRRLA
jgi:hypothetical protein